MFQKNLYTFCTLLALSSSAYAMEESDDLSSSVEKKGSRSALRSSSASWHAPEPETAVGEEAFAPFPKDTFSTDFPLEFDFSVGSEDFLAKRTASPASSTQRSLFPDGAQATFTLLALRQAADHSNPDRDLRAEALCNFIKHTFFHYQHLLDWESTVVHTLPILAHELDDNSFWKILNESKNKKKLGVSLGVYPKRHEVIKRLGEALGEYSRIYDNPDKREVKLRQMALRSADRITKLETELTELDGELEASKAQIAAQEEIERQLTSRLAELESALEASKAEAAELKTSLETERTESQRFHNAIDDLKVELLSSGVYYSSAKIQELF